MSVEQRVKQIIVEQLGVDEGQVDNSARSSTILARIRSISWNW
jgi:acyl carrier protein